MSVSYRTAKQEEAELLVQLYNAAFYEDFVTYGECPAYGRTKEKMKDSIKHAPKQLILYDGIPAGVISVKETNRGEYYVGCLCVIPKYQRRGIGGRAIEYIKKYYKDWNCIRLITPLDKVSNIHFYVEKCGFQIVGRQMDGNVEVAQLEIRK